VYSQPLKARLIMDDDTREALAAWIESVKNSINTLTEHYKSLDKRLTILGNHDNTINNFLKPVIVGKGAQPE
jgi:metallophosphoesterase superfamily enzyme